MNILEIKDLHVSMDGKKILKGLNLTLEKGKINALMGPNGCGKTTLAHILMGHPKYTITGGNIFFKGKDITELSPHKRAKLGIFLSFQYPKEINGVTISNFLRTAFNSLKTEKLSLLEFQEILENKAKTLEIDKEILARYLNEGFSGGEKKRAEILQMMVLDPSFVILDETDSGLDIDALRIVANGVNEFMNKTKTLLIITHYKRILEYIKPDKVFIMRDGKIALSGDNKLIDRLEEKGYEWIEKE